MPALDAGNGRAGHRAGQQRVFAGVFEVAPAAGIALQVDAAGQQHVEALPPGFLAHRGALGMGEGRVPAGGGGGAGGHRGGMVALADGAGIGDAQTCIHQLLGRDAEALDAGHETGRSERACRLPALVAVHAEAAADQLQLFLRVHLSQQQVGALIGRQAGIHPRARIRGAERKGETQQGGGTQD